MTTVRRWTSRASLTTAQASQHAYYRAYQVAEIRSVDDRIAIPAVPAGAEWYVSGIYVGRLIETHFWSRDGAIGGSLEAEGIIGSASIAGFARDHALEFHVRTLGLEPQGDDALFASTPGEMRAAYAEAGGPVPILVRFSRVPRSSMPVAGVEAPRQLSLVSVSFPQRNPARGTAWDVLGGNPDILVRVQQGGTTLLDRFLVQDQLEWHGNEVIGNAIVVTPDAPLVFTFTDLDMANHDAAGSTIVTMLPGIGETSTFTATEGGVTIQLRAEASP